MQIMPAAEAAAYRFNPFDLTKLWPYKDYPLIPVGRMVLNRNPDNYFAEVEQAAFNPANFVPGVGPSPDKTLQGRLFSYGDTHRYRLGANHTQLPVNRPHASGTANYNRDGAMRFDGNHGRAKNYEPNSFGGPTPITARGSPSRSKPCARNCDCPRSSMSAAWKPRRSHALRRGFISWLRRAGNDTPCVQ